MELFEANYAKFGEICGAYMLHISGICKFKWRRIIIMIINRPFLHSFDIFDYNLFNV